MPILDADRICYEIETRFADNDDLTMIDSVLEVCDSHHIDPEMVGPIINRSIKEKIYVEAQSKNYFPKENTLFTTT